MLSSFSCIACYEKAVVRLGRSTPCGGPIARVHPIAGGPALTLIAGFWPATVVVEVIGAPAAVAGVTTAIARALVVLVPALVARHVLRSSVGAQAAGRRNSARASATVAGRRS